MKTTPFKAMQSPVVPAAAAPQFSFSYDQGFAVAVGGKEVACSFFGVFYTVIELLRSGLPMKVYFQQGPLLFEHDGTRLVAGQDTFLQILADFEGYMLAERNAGKREAVEAARAAVAAAQPIEPAAPAPSPAPASAQAPILEPRQPSAARQENPDIAPARDEGLLRPPSGRRRRG